MLKQEHKDLILEEVVSDEAAIVHDPVILMDRDGDPMLIDETILGLVECKDGIWDTVEMMEGHWKQFYDHTVFIFGMAGVEGDPFTISEENDPEFIEQVRMAFQMRNL